MDREPSRGEDDMDTDLSPVPATCVVKDYDDWSVASNFASLTLASRKRKTSDHELPWGAEFNSRSDDFSLKISPRHFASTRRTSRIRLDAEGAKLYQKLEQIFLNDQNGGILKRILEFLPNSQLRVVAPVCSKWKSLCYKILRQRLRNAPFVLLWRPDDTLTVEEFVYKIPFHLEPVWLHGNTEDSVAPVTTLISFGSTFQLAHKDFSQVLAIATRSATFAYVYESELITSLPESRTLLVTSNPTSIFQSLCIPFHQAIDVVDIFIPSYSTEENPSTLTFLQDKYHRVRNGLEADNRMLKFVLVFQHIQDELTQEFIGGYINTSGTTPADVRVILTTVEAMASNAGNFPLACLWAFHGLKSLRVSTFGLNVSEDVFRMLQTFSAAFFTDSRNALVILIYRQSVHPKALMTLSFANIPVMGFRTSSPIAFQGDVLSGSPSTSRSTLQESVELNVEMVVAFIKY